MDWSHYQTAIFKAAEDGDENLIINACPGSGKTTLLQELWNRADCETLYTSFQRSIIDEAALKLAPRGHSDVRGLNSLGYAAVRWAFPDVALEQRKVAHIIRDEVTFPSSDPHQAQHMWRNLKRSVDLAKGMIGYDEEMFYNVAALHAIDIYDGMWRDVDQVLEVSDEMTGVIDFNDQLRFPYVYDLPLPSYPLVLVDELQDLNAVQFWMLDQMADRVIGVGDRHQSIFGFRGAMQDSMAQFQTRFEAEALPLSITYRCPQKVVALAQELYGDIEAAPDAQEGVVRDGEGIREVYPSDGLMLCRNNAPLVSQAYDLLRRGIPCYLRGRDIGRDMTVWLRSFGLSDAQRLLRRLQVWRDREMALAFEKDQGYRADSIMDRYETARAFIGTQRDVEAVCAGIGAMFTETRGIQLSTVHKAKGLEAEKVYILDRFRMPSKYATQPWQMEQERNIEYVALTRSQEELVFL